MNFLGGATTLDIFVKAYKTNKTKSFSPYEGIDCTEKLGNKELLLYESFFNFLRNSNPPENDSDDFENFVESGLPREQALTKLRMDNVPPTGAKSYAFLQKNWDNERMQSFADFPKE